MRGEDLKAVHYSSNTYRAVKAGVIGSVRERGDMMTAMAKEQERHVELSTYNLLSLSSYTQSSEVEPEILLANLNDRERVVLGVSRASEDRESLCTTWDAVT